MELLPIFGFSSFALALANFFQYCHRETLEEEIKALKAGKELAEKKVQVLDEINVELLNSFEANPTPTLEIVYKISRIRRVRKEVLEGKTEAN